MSSATNRQQPGRQLTLNGISATRKHVYFYALLFLGTIFTHNVWQRLQESSHPAPAVHMATEMNQMVSTAQRLMP